MGLWKELKPCTCGCKTIWVVTYESFLKHKCYVECTNCHKRTKTFFTKKELLKNGMIVNKKFILRGKDI